MAGSPASLASTSITSSRGLARDGHLAVQLLPALAKGAPMPRPGPGLPEKRWDQGLSLLGEG